MSCFARWALTSPTTRTAPATLARLPSPFNVVMASSKMAAASLLETTLLMTRRSRSAPTIATLAYPSSCAPAVFIGHHSGCAKTSVRVQFRAPSSLRLSSFRQLGDVGRDAPGLVAGEQLGRRAPTGFFLVIEVAKCLP